MKTAGNSLKTTEKQSVGLGLCPIVTCQTGSPLHFSEGHTSHALSTSVFYEDDDDLNRKNCVCFGEHVLYFRHSARNFQVLLLNIC